FPDAFRSTFVDMAHRAIGVPVRRGGRDDAGLSQREREVAQLLGEGLSNRAIAERLVLGERTVESDVSAIQPSSSSRTARKSRLSLPGHIRTSELPFRTRLSLIPYFPRSARRRTERRIGAVERRTSPGENSSRSLHGGWSWHSQSSRFWTAAKWTR